MDIKELEELKKALCEEPHKRIEKLEAKLWWLTTLALGNLIALLIYFIKGLVIK